MTESTYDIAVIGAGITGLTAAKHVAAKGLRTVSFEGSMFGGLVLNVNELDPAPDGEHSSGADLASALMLEISELGVENMSETVTALSRDNGALRVTTDAGSYRVGAVIVASGAKLRALGIPGESELAERGVSHCADCDGPLYKGQDVVVVGGGDSALQEALVLAGFCKRVHVLVRGAALRARKQLAEAVAGRDNIHLRYNTVPLEVLGPDAVTAVRARDVNSGGIADIPCSGFFPFIGLEPNAAFAPAEIARDANGCLTTDAGLQTATPGIYAAGAVRAGYSGMLTDAVAEGARAAESASRQLDR